jgi:hypothetical protein
VVPSEDVVWFRVLALIIYSQNGTLLGTIFFTRSKRAQQLWTGLLCRNRKKLAYVFKSRPSADGVSAPIFDTSDSISISSSFAGDADDDDEWYLSDSDEELLMKEHQRSVSDSSVSSFGLTPRPSFTLRPRTSSRFSENVKTVWNPNPTAAAGGGGRDPKRQLSSTSIQTLEIESGTATSDETNSNSNSNSNNSGVESRES